MSKTYTITEHTVYRVTLEDDEHQSRVYDLLHEHLTTGEPIDGVTMTASDFVVKEERV